MKVLFCCTGNTCRSPMAERIFKSELAKRKITNITAGSCGVMCANGLPMAEFAARALAKLGVADTTSHKSACITKDMVDESNLIICMTASHAQFLRQLFGESKKFLSLGEVAGTNMDVMDPFGSDENSYILCAEKIKDMLIKALDSGFFADIKG